ncbi:MAG: hypothetical protein KDJ80_11705 [Nitratireductor sp.]|nr:hypothetical protein [Nitratireductor sp.]
MADILSMLSAAPSHARLQGTGRRIETATFCACNTQGHMAEGTRFRNRQGPVQTLWRIPAGRPFTGDRIFRKPMLP